MAADEMSINARYEYLRVMQLKYQSAPDRPTKSRLLDEMESVTQLGRKYLMGLMNGPPIQRHKRTRERQRVYDDEVAQAVETVADALDWICPERLQPTLRQTAEHLIGFDEMEATPEVLAKLGNISIATLGRVLARVRPTERLPRAYPGRRADNSAQRAVPIAIIPWDEPEPGHFEVDLVHHGSLDTAGKIVCTIQFIDVLTGWSERFAILGLNFSAIWDALKRFEQRCPIPIRELHFDNGPEFINNALIACFGKELVNITPSRGRPHHHNDNRFVEQKNSSLVRAYFGTLPLHTAAQRRALDQLYEDMWLFYNFFQPVLRQIERKPVSGPNGIIRIRRKQDRARTPLDRLVTAKPPISRQTQERLLQLYAETNPLALKRGIHARIEQLTQMVRNSEKEEATPV